MNSPATPIDPMYLFNKQQGRIDAHATANVAAVHFIRSALEWLEHGETHLAEQAAARALEVLTALYPVEKQEAS